MTSPNRKGTAPPSVAKYVDAERFFLIARRALFRPGPVDARMAGHRPG